MHTAELGTLLLLLVAAVGRALPVLYPILMVFAGTLLAFVSPRRTSP